MQQILVDHISKSFGDTVIFRNTSLTIQKGHVVGIIGANGSGKSFPGYTAPTVGKYTSAEKGLEIVLTFLLMLVFLLMPPGSYRYFQGLKI